MQVSAVGFFNFIGVMYAAIQITSVTRYLKCVDDFQTAMKIQVEQTRLSSIYDLEATCYFTPVAKSATDGTFSTVTSASNNRTLEEVSAEILKYRTNLDAVFPMQISILIITFIGACLGLFFPTNHFNHMVSMSIPYKVLI